MPRTAPPANKSRLKRATARDRQAAELLLTGYNEGTRNAQVSREVGLAYPDNG